MLGWLFIDDQSISINEQMISDGYAWSYLGDTKVKDFEALAKARSKSKK
jgi:micrococcal nuclease